MVTAPKKHYVVGRIVNPSVNSGRINNPSYIANNPGQRQENLSPNWALTWKWPELAVAEQGDAPYCSVNAELTGARGSLPAPESARAPKPPMALNSSKQG